MKRLLSAVLAAALLLATLPAAFAASDIENHWAKTYIEALNKQGVINPASNGEYSPNEALTRAEFMRYINRAFGFTEKSAIAYDDVKATDWFYETVQIASAHGYINGVGHNKMDPAGTLTREQAATILGRVHKYTPDTKTALTFTDAAKVSDWSAPYVADAAKNGYIGGYTDGSFKPQGLITRAEIAKVLYFFMGTSLRTSGSAIGAANLQSDTRNVSISAPGTLSDVTVQGNLYITEGVLAGLVTLNNVTVKGNIIVSGGDVTLNGVSAAEMIVSTPLGITPQVTCTGNTNIGHTTVLTSSTLRESALSVSAGGLSDLTLAGDNLSLTLDGTVWDMNTEKPATILTTGGTDINTLTANAKTTVTGGGSIQRAVLNASGCNLTMEPVQIELASGVTATIAGDSVESSSQISVSPAALAIDINNTSSIAHSYDFTFNADQDDLAKVVCNGTTLKRGTDYALLTGSKNGIRLYKTYLTTLKAGIYSMQLVFEDGTKGAVAITTSNSASSAVSPSTIAFDKYDGSPNYTDQTVTITLPTGTTLDDVKLGSTVLERGDDYAYNATTGLVTLKRDTLAKKSVGSYTVTFVPSRGASLSCTLTVTDTAPVNELSATSVDFDANTSSGGYADLEVRINPADDAKLKYIKAGGKTLEEGWQYKQNGNTITLSKSAVASFATSNASYADFTFVMSSGKSPVLRVNFVTTYALTTTVQDDLGAPLADVAVTVTPADAEIGSPVQTATTDGDGEAVVYVKRGSYTVSATDSRFTDVKSTSVSVSGSRSVKLTAEILETVEITVTNNFGAKLSGAVITIGGKSVTTGSDGLATFSLKRGSYTAQISCSGYTTQTKALIVNNIVRERVVLQ